MIALFLKTSLYHVDKHCEYFWTFTIIFSFEQFLLSKTQKPFQVSHKEKRNHANVFVYKKSE